jgi:acetamidase/formamidase
MHLHGCNRIAELNKLSSTFPRFPRGFPISLQPAFGTLGTIETSIAPTFVPEMPGGERASPAAREAAASGAG